MKVIGKAKLLWNKYIEYVQRETINAKEHPEDSWYLDIRYKVPHEVEAIVWNCMRKIGELKNGPIAIPNEKIVEEIKKHQEYLLSIAAKWEMLFYAENVAVLRSGSLTVAVPADTVETEVYANMEHIPFGQLKRQLAGNASVSSTGTDLQIIDKMSRSDVSDQLHEECKKIEEKRKEIQNLEKEKQQELERIRHEIEEKYKNYMVQIEEKKAELEEQKKNLENQLYLMDTEIYSIRCYMGEVINFLPITKGKHAPEKEPVVIYQKVRYLDEELGKWVSIYGYDGNSESLNMFEKLLAARKDLQEIFAPGEKCVSLLKISKTGSYKIDHPMIANTLDNYETYHGKTIGILIRDGENLWLGWTDQERIQLPDGNAFYRPVQNQIIDEEDMHKNSTKEEVASRYFIFNILRGVIHDRNLIQIPGEMTMNGKNPYIILSMADGWIEDTRYGTFNDIVQRTDRPLIKGDMILTTLSITRDDHFTTRYDRWNNDRGRGEKNRTHDAFIPDRKIVPINLIDTDYIYQNIYRNLQRVFDFCKGQKCVLMLDEIDCIGLKRENGNGCDGELARTTIALMQCLDNLVDGQVVIAATNRADRLDPALLRRFHNKKEFNRYDMEEELAMITQFVDCIDILEMDQELVDYSTEGHTQAETMDFLTNKIAKTALEEIRKNKSNS